MVALPKDPQRAFDAAYARLNDTQRQAVDAVEGPVMVIAGPGTGKTQILALRIANILRVTDTAPQNILALTFTESGVASMRGRLVSLIGETGYQVPVYTFHGFCNDVLARHAERFPQMADRVPQTELDATLRVRRILDELRPEPLRPQGNPDLYTRDILGCIAEAKREHMTPFDIRERVSERRAHIEASPDFRHERGAHAGKIRGMYVQELRMLDRAEACADVYERYEEDLVRSGVYDFEDTITAVIEVLARDDELKYLLQETYQYILADEHQDANGGQNELLTLLSDFHAQPNLFVVGDEKQAIYRFQGASLENFMGFRRQYPEAQIISLTDNYRSTQSVLDAAHTLIGTAHGDAPRERLIARASERAVPVAVVCADDAQTECAYVADRIAALVERGAKLSEIAILTRRNRDLDAFAAALHARDIQHTAGSGDSLLDDPLVAGFVDFLRAVDEPGDDALLARALMLPYSGLSTLDVYRLTSVPVSAPGALFAALSDTHALTECDVRDHQACVQLAHFFDAASREESVAYLGTFLEAIFARSGALAYTLSRPDAYAALETMRAFLTYSSELIRAHPDYRLRDLISALDKARAYGLARHTAQARGDAVMLMTAHRAKGMEFDHVFIPLMHDRRWGSGNTATRLRLPLFAEPGVASTTEDDERRLLYVAMTRPRQTLTLTHAHRADGGARQVPSRFLQDIDAAHRVDMSALGAFDLPTAAHGGTEQRAGGPSAHERAYLQQRLCEQGLSVSALNNYLESPWKYFFMNLLRIPQPRPSYLLYGSAIDAALKWYTDKRRDGAQPDADELIATFSEILARQPLLREDAAQYRERGTAALRGYIDTYAASWISESESAVRIVVPFETGVPELPTITLKGELDKIEYRDGVLCVVDYKTGTPKTRGVIEGTTKNSNGNLKRQLVFYRLLLSLDSRRNMHPVGEATLDFVEPDARGRYRRESFSITDADVADLEAVIRQSVREIAQCDFWDVPCDTHAWDGCDLAQRIVQRDGIPYLSGQ